jgi:alkylation response protein AidB-like acyl-CoA dehydrogenase
VTDDEDLLQRVRQFLTAHPPSEVHRDRFLRARFDAGLAMVDAPPGLGGLGADPARQAEVDEAFAAAGAPDNAPHRNVIGLGMAAPTLMKWATPEQQQRWLRPLWTGEEIWCQLFSEPGAGSDLAAVGTAARRDGDEWVVNGQKVWTSLAHISRWALLIARTDPSLPKHQGLTFFVVDLESPGVDVRPLRQLTGEAEFNEVYLTDVRVPDAQRVGAVGNGWRVTQTTLMNERVAIGGAVGERESGPVGSLLGVWRSQQRATSDENLDDVVRLWASAEALRLASARLGESQRSGTPGPDGSGLKLAFAQLAQETSALAHELLGAEALRYDDWTLRRPDFATEVDRGAAYRYLRNRANSIEGGTSEIMRNIIAERVLNLPSEPRADKDVAWKDLPK